MAEVSQLYAGTSASETQRYKPVIDKETGQMRTPSNEVSMDLFLKLMCAQLSNQDPMQPMDDKEFLSQMASISSLQQMNALTQSFSATQAYGMVGKEVFAEIYDKAEGKMVGVSGVVSGVILSGGVAYLEVSGKYVPVSSVKAVAPLGGNSMSDQMNSAANLIGKHVTATWTEYEKKDVGGEKKEVAVSKSFSGVVERIVCKADGVYAQIKGYDGTPKEIKVAFISDIGTEKKPDPPVDPMKGYYVDANFKFVTASGAPAMGWMNDEADNTATPDYGAQNDTNKVQLYMPNTGGVNDYENIYINDNNEIVGTSKYTNETRVLGKIAQ